jgi:hypothetical protein
MADEGRVALTRGDVGFSHLKHSFAAGLTLRAGGFPMVFDDVCLGRTGGASQRFQHEFVAAGRIGTTAIGLT